MVAKFRRALPLAVTILLACAATASAAGTLSVSKSPTAAAGTVTGTYTGHDFEGGETGTITAISCGATCSAQVPDYETCIVKPTGDEYCTTHSSTVTLSAAPAAGWSFAGWTGACSGTGGCSVAMSSSKSVGASFTDVAAPSVALTGPANLSRVRNTVAVGATASDNWGVSRVDFLVDGAVAASDTSAADGWGTTLNVAAKADGDHITVTARAYDAAGRTSESAREYVIDRSAHAAFTSPTPLEDAWITSGTPQVAFTADADVVGRECRTTVGTTAGAWAACSSPYTPPTAADGSYAVDVRVTDDLGNQAVVTRHFRVDRTPPQVQITTPAPGSYRNAGFTPAFDAGGASATCALDGTDYAPCAPVATPVDGPHVLRVRARDAAGNESVAESAFTVDTVAPQVAFTGGTPQGAILTTPLASFRFEASDASPLTRTCRLDDAAAAPCDAAGAQAYSALADGPHTFRLTVTDKAGNRTERSRGFTVNAVSPSVRITSGPEDGAVLAHGDVTFGFAAAGAVEVKCSLDSATAFRNCSAAAADALTGVGDGPHVFRVRARDESDDVAVAARTFHVDGSTPETSIDAGPAAGSATPADQVTFAFHASAPGSSFRCRFGTGGGPFVPCSGPGATHHVEGLAPGAYVFEVQAVNPLGTADPTPARRAFTLVRPLPPLQFRVANYWAVWPAGTRVRDLTVKGLPPGAKVRVDCGGRGCPFRSRAVRVRKGRAALAGLFRRRFLAARAQVTIQVTAPGVDGRVVRFTMRRGRQPRRTDLCLPRGTRRAKAC